MVKLLIDSAADIGAAEAKKLGIEMISMVISFGDEEYFDGVNLSPKEFYQKLEKSKVNPKTAQISPFRFEEAFEKGTEKGDELVVITISSKLSGTYAAAAQAAEKFKGKVFVLDSLSATAGERLLAQYALRLIGNGLSGKEILEELERVKTKVCVMGVLDTLEYLKRGGRISGAVAFVGGVLNVKPVVRVIGGEVKMVGKARGQKKGYELMNGIVRELDGIDFSMPYGVLWTGTDESIAQKYVTESADIFEGNADAPTYMMGSTIGTHVGPGVVGIAFFQK